MPTFSQCAYNPAQKFPSQRPSQGPHIPPYRIRFSCSDNLQKQTIFNIRVEFEPSLRGTIDQLPHNVHNEVSEEAEQEYKEQV